MGCGTSQNAVVPVHYIENQNGSALRIDSPPKSEVLEYMSQEEVKDADDRSMQVDQKDLSIESLTELLSKDANNNASCTRSFFKWITCNIRFDPQCDTTDIQNILSNKRCAADGFVNLFENMCRLKNISSIRLYSPVKSHSFIPELSQIDSNNRYHVWNAVLINRSYHHVDCTWAAIPVKNRKLRNDVKDVDCFFFTSSGLVGDWC